MPVPCAAGTFSNHFGAESCHECPDGFYCPVGTILYCVLKDIIPLHLLGLIYVLALLDLEQDYLLKLNAHHVLVDTIVHN